MTAFVGPARLAGGEIGIRLCLGRLACLRAGGPAGPWPAGGVTGGARALTIAAVAGYGDCLSCAFERRPDVPPRERTYLDAHWRVAHAFGTAQPGWLVVLPRRHVLALSHVEAAGLGPLLRAVTAALREVTGCAKTYVALFAEAEGFGHVHFHVVPRSAGLDPQLRGPRIFALLGGDPARHVPDSDMDQLAGQLTAALSRAR